MTYIAMNRFKVPKENGSAFEDVWAKRESYLDEMEGFVSFHLLRGPEAEDHVLYSSHTVWASKEDFLAWTKSDAFRKAHARAGDTSKRVFVGHPQFEGFEAVQSEFSKKPSAA
ncbi:antibiotic biosynthesis monooxygenase family protein [Aestuariivirga sp.]|uniref:antibiotic biosynthesis monooxygenase family protein n=1 Tax=Aestuariivirga sp. TaxID=2650926 RepID=UPI0039E27940